MWSGARPEAIEWCQREVTSRYPNFRFTHVDVFNAAYNPSGALRASEFSFPYRAEQFDLVFLYSVFTHLLPEALEHYLSEIGRVNYNERRQAASFGGQSPRSELARFQRNLPQYRSPPPEKYLLADLC